jgi:outer membrane protein assembly factor BamB
MWWLHAVTARHGTLLGGEGPRGTPTIHEGMVYAQGATGIVRCLDGRTGKAVWSIDLLRQYGATADSDRRAVAWGRAGSPLVVDDLLITPYGGPANGRRYSLAAFDRFTGAPRWKSGDRQVSYSSPAVGTLCGQRQVVIVNEDSVSGHRPEDGAVLWSTPWPGSSTASPSASQAVIVPPDRILVSKGYGIGAALLQLVADDNGRIDVQSVWTNPKVLKTKFTNVVVQDASVFALSDGIMECVDLNTGRPRWKNRREGNFGHGQILAAGDLILVQAESGDVVLIEASTDELKILGRVQALQDRTWNNLCLYGPYLLVRNSVEAACFELPLKGDRGGPGAL